MPSLIHPKERIYFTIALIVSVLVYAGLIVWAVKALESFAIVLVYLFLGLFASFLIKGLFLGHVRGNGIRVSEHQFPELYQAAQRLAAAMGLERVPDIFVLQSGGLLNAFATKFLGRKFVVLYSSIVEVALEKGEAEVEFVLCHELAHLKRKHLTWRMVLIPANLIPLLGAAYSRGCEYTCDRFGAYYAAKGATGGLAVLAAGGRLFQRMNIAEFRHQADVERGLWVWYAEKIASHPHLTKRIRAVQEFQQTSGIPVAAGTAAGN